MSNDKINEFLCVKRAFCSTNRTFSPYSISKEKKIAQKRLCTGTPNEMKNDLNSIEKMEKNGFSNETLCPV